MSRHKFTKPKTSMFGIIGKVAPWLAFVSQITSKDTAAIQAQPNTISMLQAYANAITGRITGINLFKNVSVQPKQTINFSNILNPWTSAGIAAMIYGELAKHITVLPQGGKVRSIGKKVFIGGAVGAIFDDPAPGVPTQQYSSPTGYTNTILGTGTYGGYSSNLPLLSRGN